MSRRVSHLNPRGLPYYSSRPSRPFPYHYHIFYERFGGDVGLHLLPPIVRDLLLSSDPWSQRDLITIANAIVHYFPSAYDAALFISRSRPADRAFIFRVLRQWVYKRSKRPTPIDIMDMSGRGLLQFAPWAHFYSQMP